MIAIGALNGSIEELYKHIELSQSAPDEYKDQLKLLYLAKNHSYEKYAIIDVSINDKKRIDKIAILATDAKGNVLGKSFLSSGLVMLQGMYHALESADYIVGCNLSAIKDNIKKECEFSGYTFSEEWVGVSTDKEELAIIHNEGYYLDSFNKPWIDLPQLNIKEKDPSRRVYDIKEIMVTTLDSCVTN